MTITLNEVHNISEANYIVFSKGTLEFPIDIVFGKVYEIKKVDTELYGMQYFVIDEKGVDNYTSVIILPQKYYV
ncbi:hypothetical protein MHB54_27875 [Paenibacillus sp. FSL M7-0802]|uniref:hypothetical protein n=1 Tax=Paenibacillus sp. FSL M7-0802 TaxID=2921536 RepID=UPI0030FBE36E